MAHLDNVVFPWQNRRGHYFCFRKRQECHWQDWYISSTVFVTRNQAARVPDTNPNICSTGMSLEEARPDQFSHRAKDLLTIDDIKNQDPGHIPGKMVKLILVIDIIIL